MTTVGEGFKDYFSYHCTWPRKGWSSGQGFGA